MHPALKTLCAILAMSASTAVLAGEPPQWGYAGEAGPDNWGKLAPEYSLCATGKNQSPIDLVGMIDAELSPIKFDYASYAAVIHNNGHTIETSFAPGSGFDIDGRRFDLKQVHFHVPGENRVNGKSFPMEAQLVHADENGNLAVVAVMYQEGEKNEALQQIWVQMPERAGDKLGMRTLLNAEDMLPKSPDYYRYNGSLTTPPCSEGVTWLVMKQPVSASKEQIELFTHIMHHANNRPVQPVNARPVLK